MGRKRSGKGMQIYLCIAALILLSVLACTLNKTLMNTTITDTTGEEARTHLNLGRKFLAEGNYKSALRENEKVMSLAGKNISMDEPLFYTGLIYAHPGNPSRDYGKSLSLFKNLINDYPGSFLIEQAKAIVALLQENDALNRKVENLSNTIDELKKVDIGIEQKKKETAQ
jgi:hypothetical protein